MVKNPKIMQIFVRIDFEANKIVLAQDLLKKIHKYERYCENKLIWVNSLFFICKYIQFSTLSLDSALKQEGQQPWFPKEKWSLFFQEEIYGKIHEKVKTMVNDSRKNSEILLAKLFDQTQIIVNNESSFLEGFCLNLTILLKEYKKTLYDNNIWNNDKLVTTIYELMTLLNIINSRIVIDHVKFKFDKFRNELDEILEKKRWIILQRLELFFEKMSI